jgi:hypothetical protein
MRFILSIMFDKIANKELQEISILLHEKIKRVTTFELPS